MKRDRLAGGVRYAVLVGAAILAVVLWFRAESSSPASAGRAPANGAARSANLAAPGASPAPSIGAAARPPTTVPGRQPKVVFQDTDDMRAALTAYSDNPDALEVYTRMVPMVEAVARCAPDTPRGSYMVWMVYDLDANGEALLREVRKDDALEKRDASLKPISDRLLGCVRSYTKDHADASFPTSAGHHSSMQVATYLEFPIEEWYPRQLAIENGWKP